VGESLSKKASFKIIKQKKNLSEHASRLTGKDKDRKRVNVGREKHNEQKWGSV